MNEITVCEYIWLDGRGNLRSKTRVLRNIAKNLSALPVWNYDGSSTEQANGDGNTEVLLTPVFMCDDPLRPNINAVLVLCETSCERDEETSCETNFRQQWTTASNCTCEPWFGIEQEYTICFSGEQHPITNANGQHYCGISIDIRERSIVEEHFLACLDAGLTISGINAEVATRQWEFQIGPVCGVEAADQTYIARFLLERIAEKYDAWISYFPKLSPDANGQGCHINFSTKQMRNAGGMEVILSCMEKLEKKHKEHIQVYGENNHLRLTGKHETSSIDVFTFGNGTRNTSVRIPIQTVKDGCGYFEDRRPAANVELYQATYAIYNTCTCLHFSQ